MNFVTTIPSLCSGAIAGVETFQASTGTTIQVLAQCSTARPVEARRTVSIDMSSLVRQHTFGLASLGKNAVQRTLSHFSGFLPFKEDFLALPSNWSQITSQMQPIIANTSRAWLQGQEIDQPFTEETHGKCPFPGFLGVACMSWLSGSTRYL